jgi:tol-pal system protein YbgF
MTCEEARRAFTDLYDGTLSGPPLVDLSRHLDGCVTCRRHWVAFRLTAGALGDLRDEEPSPGFAARVVERIEAPRWWRRLGSSLVLPLRVKLPIHAAALVMLGMAGLWVSQRSPEIQRAADPGAPPVERPVTVSPPAPVASVPPPESKPAPRTPKPAAPVPRPVPPTPAPPAAAKVEAPAIVRQEKAAPPPPAGAPQPAAEAPTSSLAKRSESEAPGPPVLRSAPGPSDARDRSQVEGLAAPGTAAKEARVAAPARGTADDLFSVAATVFAAQDYAQAVLHLRAFLAQYPTDRRAPDAHFFLAEAYRAQQQYAQAGAAFAAFVHQYPAHRRAATALYRQGEVALAAGDSAGCAILREALSRYPEAREAAPARESLSSRCP